MLERNESDAQLQSSPEMSGDIAGETPQHEYVAVHEGVIPRSMHEVLSVPELAKGNGPHRQNPLLESSKQHVVWAELLPLELPPELLPHAERERARINALGSATNQPEPRDINVDVSSKSVKKSRRRARDNHA